MTIVNLNDYRMARLAAHGQRAHVYCAIHQRTSHLVAVKQIYHHTERAAQEARILEQLEHPDIVGCYSAEQINGRYQFVLEYCELGTLRDYLDAFCPLPFEQAIALISNVLSAISYVHSQGIVHGDIKPENILLKHTKNGLIAKLSDFGNACFGERSFSTLEEMGSPTYAAPERFDGVFSYASDLYSIGIILYEVLLCDRPFSGTPQQLRKAHKEQDISLSKQLSNSVKRLLTTALNKDPLKRFPSAGAMSQAINELDRLYQDGLARCSVSVPAVQSCMEQAVSAINIAEPVKDIISTSQGCCLQTQSALYLYQSSHHLHSQTLTDSITPFSKAVVEPNYQWLMTFKKGDTAHLESLDANYSPHKITFHGAAPTFNKVQTCKWIAIDHRYLARISSSLEESKTFVDYFTRKGQFTNRFTLHFFVKAVSLTRTPAQIIVSSNTKTSLRATVALVSLQAFRVRLLPCSVPILCATATSWGYVAVGYDDLFFFDRDYRAIGKIKNTFEISAIAPLNPRQLLFSTPNSPNAYLHCLNLDKLDLDLIF